MEHEHTEVTHTHEKRKKISKKKLALIGVIVLVLVGIGGLGAAIYKGKHIPYFPSSLQLATFPDTLPEALREKTFNKTVAVVNGEKIDRNTYNTMLASVAGIAESQGKDVTKEEVQKEIKKEALTLVIDNLLLQQAAKNSGIVVDKGKIDEQILSVTMQLKGDHDAFVAELKKFGFTEDEYRDLIEKQLMLDEYIGKTIAIDASQITDDQIKEYYNTAIGTAPEGVEVPSLDEAKEQIRAFMLEEKKQEAVEAHVAELRSKADIKENISL